MTKRQTVISVILKLLLALCVFAGVFIAGKGRGFMGGGTALLYFTIQSNLWIAVTCIAGAVLLLCKVRLKPWMFVVKLVFTVAITLTGFVFCVMLAPLLKGGAWSVQNILTHVVVPLLSIADFLFYDSCFNYKMKHSVFVAIPPFYYVIFAGIGYARGWNFGGGQRYPYFFLNWGSEAGAFGFSSELPYMGVIWWLAVLVIFLTAVASLYIFLAGRIAKHRADRGLH